MSFSTHTENNIFTALLTGVVWALCPESIIAPPAKDDNMHLPKMASQWQGPSGPHLKHKMGFCIVQYETAKYFLHGFNL